MCVDNFAQRRRAILMLPLFLVAVLAVSQNAFAGTPASTDLRLRIARALLGDAASSAAIEKLGSQLQVLTPGLSLDSSLGFRAAKINAAAQPGWHLVRLECVPRSACLPFNSLVPSATAGLQLAKTAETATEASETVTTASPIPGQQGAVSPLIHRGDRVTVVELRSGMRLETAAVCLQTGRQGEKIQVRNLATKRIVVATVVSRETVVVD